MLRILSVGRIALAAILVGTVYFSFHRTQALDLFTSRFISERQVETFDFQDTASERQCFYGGGLETTSIPKIVHVIWLNNPDLDFIQYLTLRSALISLKPDELRFHYTVLNEDNIYFNKLRRDLTLIRHDLNQEYSEQIRRNWQFSHIADILRLHALQEGGIYLDMDVITLRSFDSLLRCERDVLLGHEGGNRNGLCNAIIVARKSSQFINRWIESYSNFTTDEWNYHSVILPKQLSLQHPDEICALSPTVFFWPTWTAKHIRYMHEPISESEAKELEATILVNHGSLYPNQLAYHAWSQVASSYLEALSPEIVKKQNTRFNVLTERRWVQLRGALLTSVIKEHLPAMLSVFDTLASKASAMAAETRTEELLRRPLYVYDLPQELLATITPKGEDHRISVKDTPEPPLEASEEPTQDRAIATSTSCTLCKVSFLNVQEQREHVRSDHHRYNSKAQLRGNPALDEVQFSKAIGELDESISGSESSGGEDDEEDNQLTALLKRQARLSQTAEEVEATSARGGAGKDPLLWFSSSSLPSNTSLGIYRALFTRAEQDEPTHLADSLRKKQLTPIHPQKNSGSVPAKSSSPSPHIFMCMIGGGHFAAMLVSLAPEIHRKQGGIEERQARVIAHKTFHRYTTRRKQGGSQSANDASKGAAHSAGSSLRRYNEAALEKEIRELLSDWKQMIDDAEFMFVRAAGSTNRRILFGQYEGQVLKQNDLRLRGFPFSTRRATQGELMRCFKELTRIKVSQIDEAALAAAAAVKQKEEASKPSTPRPQQQQKPKLSQEEEAAIMHTTQIQALIRRSKIPALMAYLTKNSIPSNFTFQPHDSQQNFRCPTPLHLAANFNSPAMVSALLSKADADPTAINDEGRTPFELAGDRLTRDAFRISRHELGERRWDWEAARVPSALSRSDANDRIERERKATEEEESNRRKAEMDRLKKEEAARTVSQASKKGGRTLGSVEKTAAEKREEEMRGMAPEMRMRLERERRARAAEERIRRMQGN